MIGGFVSCGRRCRPHRKRLARKWIGAKSNGGEYQWPSRNNEVEPDPRFEVLMSDVTSLRPGSIIGDTAMPPFAVPPDPTSLFINRSRRLAASASRHGLGPYLRFWLPLRIAFAARPTASAIRSSKVSPIPSRPRAMASATAMQRFSIRGNGHALEAAGDDVTSSGLGDTGWKRSAANALLIGN